MAQDFYLKNNLILYLKEKSVTNINRYYFLNWSIVHFFKDHKKTVQFSNDLFYIRFLKL